MLRGLQELSLESVGFNSVLLATCIPCALPYGTMLLNFLGLMDSVGECADSCNTILLF